MNLSELSENRTNVIKEDSGDHAVKINKASFKWNSNEEEANLKDIELQIKKKSLVAVVGTVGSGKSSLMSAILGEMISDESIDIDDSIGYCAQQGKLDEILAFNEKIKDIFLFSVAWIQNATLKNNILFHRHFEKDRYNQVIDACALKDDLKTLPAGDATEIGEKGINLSGGQKHRVALARLVYRYDIFQYCQNGTFAIEIFYFLAMLTYAFWMIPYPLWMLMLESTFLTKSLATKVCSRTRPGSLSPTPSVSCLKWTKFWSSRMAKLPNGDLIKISRMQRGPFPNT